MTKEMNIDALNANLRMLDKQSEMNLEMLRRQDAAAADRLEKINELLKDGQFAEEFISADSAGEAVMIFADHGVEVSEDEVIALAKQVAAAAKKLLENSGELSMEDMEQIAGGRSYELQDLKNGAGFSVIGAGIGTMFCIGIGTAAGAAIGAVIGIMVGTPIAEGVNAVKKLGGWIKSWF